MGYFLIWKNYIHDFFFFQFLSRLTERSRSKNSCNQIKQNKASFLTSASNNWKFCRATRILGNFLLNYIMSTQWTQVLSQSFFKTSNTRTQKSESFSCTVRNHLWLRATNCGKTSFSLFHSNVMQYYTIMEPFKKKKTDLDRKEGQLSTKIFKHVSNCDFIVSHKQHFMPWQIKETQLL